MVYSYKLICIFEQAGVELCHALVMIIVIVKVKDVVKNASRKFKVEVFSYSILLFSR